MLELFVLLLLVKVFSYLLHFFELILSPGGEGLFFVCFLKDCLLVNPQDPLNTMAFIELSTFSPLEKLVFENCSVPRHWFSHGPLRTKGTCKPVSYPGREA